MKEKKTHWWSKLKDIWANTDQGTKNLVKCSAMTFVTGAIVSGITVNAIDNYKANKDIAEITKFAGEECVRAYDQGVYDGATNPELLKNLKDLGRI